jgi:hypothetical protein
MGDIQLRPRTFIELLTFKMDRSFAVLGIVALGLAAILVMKTGASTVVTAAISALGVVLGARITK